MDRTCAKCHHVFSRGDIKVFQPVIINDKLTPVLLCRSCFLLIDTNKEARDKLEKELSQKGAQ